MTAARIYEVLAQRFVQRWNLPDHPELLSLVQRRIEAAAPQPWSAVLMVTLGLMTGAGYGWTSFTDLAAARALAVTGLAAFGLAAEFDLARRWARADQAISPNLSRHVALAPRPTAVALAGRTALLATAAAYAISVVGAGIAAALSPEQRPYLVAVAAVQVTLALGHCHLLGRLVRRQVVADSLGALAADAAFRRERLGQLWLLTIADAAATIGLAPALTRPASTVVIVSGLLALGATMLGQLLLSRRPLHTVPAPRATTGTPR